MHEELKDIQMNEQVMHILREVAMVVIEQKAMQQPDTTNQSHIAKATNFFSTQIMKKQHSYPLTIYGVPQAQVCPTRHRLCPNEIEDAWVETDYIVQ